MHKLSFVLSFIIILKINYLNAFSVNNELNPLGTNRTKRQGNIQTCSIPKIDNGKVKIIREKSFPNAPASSYLLLNVTCDHNYILYPPNNNLALCVNSFWDQEIPQCIQCGQRMDQTHKPFLVNGTLAKFGDFPWHVGIYRKKSSNSHPLYICGGSIISDNSILTVAHCFTDESGRTTATNEYFIAAGKYYSSYNSDKDTYAQKRKVAKIDIHPRYKGYFTNYAWDIAVLIIDEPFEISNVVQPICVDWMTDFENEQLIPNNLGEIAGWGATEMNLDSFSQEMRMLQVPFIKADQCTKLVPDTFIRYITPDKFCAGYTNGSSVCGGDSGGGLVFKRKENRDTRFYIRGLVSVGVQIEGRCDDYKYSTYTKVSEYLSFIRESISNKIIPATLPLTTPLPTAPPPTTPPPTTPPPTIRPSTTKSPETLITPSVPCLTPNGEHAKCISISQCQIFKDALQNSPTLDVIKFIRDSECGTDKKVCCGSTTNFLTVINSNPVTIKPLIHRNLNLLPTPGVCGRPVRLRQARIYGGNATTLLDFPWMVRLEFGGPNKSVGFYCAGTLINDRYVLTTGRCDFGFSPRISGIFRVRLGEYNTETDIDCVDVSKGTGTLPNEIECADPPLNIDVEKIITHPFFNSHDDKLINDIALIRLSRKINFTDFIKPICLPLNGEHSLPGRQMVIAGWGRTENDSLIKIKQKAFVPAVAHEDCVKVFKDKAHMNLQSYHICAGGQKGVGCYVDIGGPLMGTLFNSRDYYVEGMVSSGTGNCEEGILLLYTRVSSFIDWILDTIEP